jgi:hypothetical protein
MVEFEENGETADFELCKKGGNQLFGPKILQ